MCKATAVILQGLATIFSGGSSAAIIGLLHIQDTNTRGIMIIVCAVSEFIMHIFKLLFSMDCGDKSLAKWNLQEGLIKTSTNTKSKAVILGLVDCAFDLIAAIAILNGIEFSAYTAASLLITLGTFIGLSEEITELILELVLWCFEMNASSNDSSNLEGDRPQNPRGMFVLFHYFDWT
eukprot:178328_1